MLDNLVTQAKTQWAKKKAQKKEVKTKRKDPGEADPTLTTVHCGKEKKGKGIVKPHLCLLEHAVTISTIGESEEERACLRLTRGKGGVKFSPVRNV